MKRSGRTVALVIVGALFWILAVVHPLAFFRDREAALRERPKANVTPRIYTLLSEADGLQARLRSSEVIGYVSEGDFDLRVGGPLQGRYYLAQYALAPTLLRREEREQRVVEPARNPSGDSKPGRESSEGRSLQPQSPELVLACFRHPRQLETFLAETDRTSVLALSPNVALTLTLAVSQGD